MIVYSVHGWRHFPVCTYVLHFVCFGEETWNCMHFLVILSLKTLWAGVKHWWTALHRFYVYRKPIDHLQDLAIWCLDNWSRILSGKPFKTFSMARLKTLQFRLTLSPFLSFHCHACIFFSLSQFFFMICDWGNLSFLCRRLFFYSRDPRFMSLIDSPWFVKFSKMANFNFQSSIFVVISVNRDLDFFLIFWDSWPETPPPFFF